METTITITFGEQGENDPGMETLGAGLADEGFSVEDLERMKTVFDESGYKTQLINLNAFIREQEYRALADGSKNTGPSPMSQLPFS